MAPRQRDPPPAPSILSNVLSFVSHEIESFVATAIGVSDNKVQPVPQASSSRVKLDDELDEDEIRGKRRAAKKKRAHSSVGEYELEKPRRRRLPRSESDSDSDLPSRRRTVKKKFPPPRSSTPQLDGTDGSDRGSRSPSPSPPPLPALLRRRPSVTMPGSLYPRSESLQPDSSPPFENSHHVRFLSRSPSPSPHSQTKDVVKTAKATNTEIKTRSDLRVDRSETILREHAEKPEKHINIAGRTKEKAPQGARNNQGETTGRGKDDIERLEDDIDPSRTLPSSRQRKGKGRAEEDVVQPARVEDLAEKSTNARGKDLAWDTSGEIRVRGKERELHAAREAHLRNEPARDDEEREHDKRRIRMLEEEIARLKAQLAARDTSYPRTNTFQLQPPPPPPPPPPLRPPQVTTNPLLTGNPLASGVPPGHPDTFLTSMRASLKHTAPPVEAPINPPGRTRRAGQPTVNVPSDKMAAFLNEMKTVRLRKVSGGKGGAGAMPPPPLSASASLRGIARSASGGEGGAGPQRYAFGERSFSTVETRIGEKRKRDAENAGEREAIAPVKRLFTTVTSSDTGTNASFTSVSTSTSTSASTNTSYDARGPFARGYLPPRTWPSVSTTETDITTPSLCSDNENENEHEREEPLPDTPPGARGRGGTQPRQKPGDEGQADDVVLHHDERGPEREPELPRIARVVPPEPEAAAPAKVRDVPAPSPSLPASPPARTDVFARRLPRSPMPADTHTPRRPRPPARKRARPASASARGENEDGSEGDDPLLLSFAPPVLVSGRHDRALGSADLPPKRGAKRKDRDKDKGRPRAASKTSSVSSASASRAGASTSNHARRQRTLDEELQRAGDSLWVGSGDEIESGELVGVGTQSTRRGFLKGGGAAGRPVFMGVGYVQGAEEDAHDGDVNGEEEEEEDGPRLPWRRRSGRVGRR
ncbi:hypothetical protein AcW1_008487 [Taiwanofungus camphoratus]|nr:hypothetical protein AcV5_008777 [Antrodia cinnamomea]KAI0951444.1 hypothetical protein AcW1_008487 [Antrodia cinnamomea]